MIDINELRRMVNAAQFESFANSVINSLLDRLEAAEKERNDLAQQLVQSEIGKRKISEAHEVATRRLSSLAGENITLQAKIAEMERQEPVAWIRGRDDHRRRKLSFEKPVNSSPDKLHWSPLVYLPGAKGE